MPSVRICHPYVPPALDVWGNSVNKSAMNTAALHPVAAAGRRIFGAIWLYRIIRCAIGGLFILAGANKLADLEAFAYTIWEYDLLAEEYIDYVAYSLPVLEVLAGLGLIANVRGSLTAVTAMLVFFIAVLWWGILGGLSIDCGCFGTGDEASPESLKAALIRDLWMLAGCAYCYGWRWLRPAASRHA
ncbi:MauE/DoxX family redox-associated membrane protein [Megalodesulfovibrio gigas]|uniref:MauE/DoxX family redox-associated membrane protein n=1 Tax=Megalodesulfovibrio gigas TaxID=879 RepID=UPI000B1D3B96|nr:MauE/DoxX family redox-associated membrane protein [Megalodesulfovibrio gigas]